MEGGQWAERGAEVCPSVVGSSTSLQAAGPGNFTFGGLSPESFWRSVFLFSLSLQQDTDGKEVFHPKVQREGQGTATFPNQGQQLTTV